MVNVEKEIKQFCDNIKFIRELCGFKKSKMAQIMGVTINTLNEMEKGNLPSKTSCRVIVEVANYFEILPSTLISVNLRDYTNKPDE